MLSSRGNLLAPDTCYYEENVSFLVVIPKEFPSEMEAWNPHQNHKILWAMAGTWNCLHTNPWGKSIGVIKNHDSILCLMEYQKQAMSLESWVPFTQSPNIISSPPYALNYYLVFQAV